MKIESAWRNTVFVLACSSALAFGLLLASAGPAQAQMTLPGQFSVSPAGAATYSIPVQLPPGVAGMEPKLALNYNSQSGNGILGMGWSLSGLSSITRCSQTMSQDGARLGVTFTATDRYCLDGQRLVNVPPPNVAGTTSGTTGVYGADQTYYSTEREGFSRIQSFGSVGTAPYTGPSIFKVWTKSGLIMEYGNTTDSRILAVAATSGSAINTTARVWALNKVTDVKGNYYSISYAQDNTGQYVPVQINYTGNASSSPALTPSYSIVFGYESRADVVPAYSWGSVSRLTVRLSSINVVMSPASTSVIAYAFQYHPIMMGNSRVSQITRCYGNSCLPATTLTYENYNTLSFSTFSGGNFVGGWGDSSLQNFVADVNGDGRPDLIRIWNNQATGSAQADVLLSNGTEAGATFIGVSNGSIGSWVTGARYYVADVNGDGRADIVKIWNNSGTAYAHVWLSQGTTFALSSSTPIGGWGDASLQNMVADIDGDGRADILRIWNNNGGAQADLLLSNGVGFSETSNTIVGGWLDSAGKVVQNLLADIDGDGKTDIVRIWNNNGTADASVWLSNGQKFIFASDTPIGGVGDSTLQNIIADVNGDGRLDIVRIWNNSGKAQADVLCSTGIAFVGISSSIMHDWLGSDGKASQYYLKDVDGDGKADIVVIRSTDRSYAYADVVLSDGVKYSYASTGSYIGGAGDGTIQNQVFDFNADGKADIVRIWNNNGKAQADILVSNAPQLNLLTSIFNGMSSIQVTYKPLPQIFGGVYTSTTNPSYPQLAPVPAFPVVVSSQTSDGMNGWRATNYSYGNLLAEAGTGRGLLGFQWMQSQDVSTGQTTRTTYRQDFPFTGQVASTAQGTSPASWNNLNLTQYQYTCIDFVSAPTSVCTLAAGKRYFVYPSTIDTTGNKDLTTVGQPGAGLPGNHATQVMDNWGNLTQSVVQTQDAGGAATDFSRTTNNVYAPADVTNWRLGRLLRSTTTATAH